MKQIFIIFTLLILNSCLHKSSRVKGVIAKKESIYHRVGQCTALKLVSLGYNREAFKTQALAASKRVQSSKRIWNDLSRSKFKEGHFLSKYKRIYQKRGYLQPAFLAGFGENIPDSVNDIDQTAAIVIRRAEVAADQLAEKLRKQNDRSINPQNLFHIVFESNGRDFFKTVGSLSAMTAYDRWRAESLSLVLKSSRVDLTVLPHLISSVGQGDQVGQIYHFWGFVGLIMSQPSFTQGILEAGAVTNYYEIARNYIKYGKIDWEDHDIDKKAVQFSYGLMNVLKRVRYPSKIQSLQEIKKIKCDQIENLKSHRVNKNQGVCRVWALKKMPRFSDKGSLLERTDAPEDFKDYIGPITACYQIAQDSIDEFEEGIAIWQFNPQNKKPITKLLFKSEGFPPLHRAHPNPLVENANLTGGSCEELRKVCRKSFCFDSHEQSKECFDAFQYKIEVCVNELEYGLKKGRNCSPLKIFFESIRKNPNNL